MVILVQWWCCFLEFLILYEIGNLNYDILICLGIWMILKMAWNITKGDEVVLKEVDWPFNPSANSIIDFFFIITVKKELNQKNLSIINIK